jgi:thioredoxin-like negative regulator of GroEL
MDERTPGVIELTKQNFAASINHHPFAACRAFAPTFASAAQKHPDALFAKVNTEEQRELAAYFHIRSIPTLAVFRENIIVFLEPGALGAGDLEQVLMQAKSLDMESVRRSIEAEESAEAAKAPDKN